MVGNSLSEQSRQFDCFPLSRRNKHVGKFLSEYVPLLLIVGVDQPWLWSNSNKGQSLLISHPFPGQSKLYLHIYPLSVYSRKRDSQLQKF